MALMQLDLPVIHKSQAGGLKQLLAQLNADQFQEMLPLGVNHLAAKGAGLNKNVDAEFSSFGRYQVFFCKKVDGAGGQPKTFREHEIKNWRMTRIMFDAQSWSQW
jgi:hypothetical protein